MHHFIHNLISRHARPMGNIMPRLRSRFENREHAQKIDTEGTELTREEHAIPVSKEPPVTDRPVTDLPGDKKDQPAQQPTRAERDEGYEYTAQNVKAALPGKAEVPIKENGTHLISGPIEELQGPASYLQEEPAVPGTEKPLSSFAQKQTPNYLPVAEPQPDLPLEPADEPTAETKKRASNTPELSESLYDDHPVKPVFKNEDARPVVVQQGGILGDPPGMTGFKEQKNNESGSFENTGAQSRPVIKVSIGKIHVRAITQPVVATRKETPVAKPSLSLDDYLKERNKKRS